MSIREFVFRQLEQNGDFPTIQREVEERFGYCGLNYVTRLKREWTRLKTAALAKDAARIIELA